MSYWQNVNGNISLKFANFQEATENSLHIADIPPILVRFSAEIVKIIKVERHSTLILVSVTYERTIWV